MEETNNTQHLPTEEDIKQFLMLREVLASVYLEMKEFSKKKPDEPLNKFKVKNINRVLSPIKNILQHEPTAIFLDLLNDDELPSNSDAILIIGQYTASMERFEKTYFLHDSSRSSKRWSTVENPVKRNSYK